jgi:hypothetical protein
MKSTEVIMENEMGYILAHGPEGLEAVLNELLEKSKLDPTMKERAHFILYELGNQKSLIKMDLNEWPVVFWHYDLLGRAATSVVKDILARFAWDKCGEREWYYKEKGNPKLHAKGNGHSTEENDFSEWRQSFFEEKN